jgi:lysozyme
MVLAMATVAGIQGFEQFRGTAYMPTPNDVPTIGFGTTEGVKMGDTITLERAQERLVTELDTVYVAAVKKHVKVPLYDYEFGALVSFVYNVGVGNFLKSTLLKKLNAGDYAGAAAEISKWDKQKGKVLKGLTKRRAEERAIFEGKYA